MSIHARRTAVGKAGAIRGLPNTFSAAQESDPGAKMVLDRMTIQPRMVGIMGATLRRHQSGTRYLDLAVGWPSSGGPGMDFYRFRAVELGICLEDGLIGSTDGQPGVWTDLTIVTRTA